METGTDFVQDCLTGPTNIYPLWTLVPSSSTFRVINISADIARGRSKARHCKAAIQLTVQESHSTASPLALLTKEPAVGETSDR